MGLDGAKAGDFYVEGHLQLARDTGRRLSRQVQTHAERAGQEASRHFGRKFAAGLAIGGAAIGVGLVKAVRGIKTTTDAASALNEQVNKSNAIFGKSSGEIQRWSRGAAKNLGQSRTQALTNAAAFGDMFLQLKLGQQPATAMSKRMVELASDLASFNDADITQVLEAQQSAFRGEFDALQRFIPNINAARVEQEALRQTHKASTKDLTAAEKAQAAYSIMVRDSARAHGDYGRTLSTSVANQNRKAKAQWEDLKVTLGQGFLPAQLAVTRVFTEKLLPAGMILVKQFGPALQRVVGDSGQRLTDMVPPADQLADAVLHLGERLQGGFQAGMAKIHELGPQVLDLFKQVGPALKDTNLHAEQFVPTVQIGAAALELLANNADLIARHLPVVIGLFLAWKAAQGLANVAAAASVALKPLEIASNFALASSIRKLRQETQGQTASSLAGAVAQKAVAGATASTTAATSKGRLATLAGAVASKIAAAASVVFSVALRAVGVAMAFATGPIGIAIAVIALLVAGVVLAYKRSETFRNVVHKVWDAVKDKVATAVNFIIGLLRGWLNFQFKMVEGILHVMGKLPGPMGAPFRKAEEAVRKARETVNTQLDKIQARVNRLRGKDIPIKASLALNFSPSFTQKDWVQVRLLAGRMAAGGLVREGTTATADDVLARLSRGEYVLNAAAVRTIGVERLNRLNAMRFAGGGPVGAIDAESHAINKIQARGTAARMDRGITKMLGAFGARPPHTAGGWRFAVEFLRRLGIAYQVISTFRPGARTHASGAVSFHALNRAVDLTGDMMAIFNALARTNPTELIYSHAPFYISRRGRRPIGALDPITFMDHLSHVHAAYRRGGLVMDGGGYLMPGWNPPLYNGTGQPEQILGPREAGLKLHPDSVKALAAELAANPPMVEIDGVRLQPVVRKQLRSLGYRDGLRAGV